MDVRIGLRAWLAVSAATVALAGAAGAQEACDRECLIGVSEAYLAAMVAHDPARAPVAQGIKFTENTNVLALGEGSAWTGVTGVRDYKVYVADADAGQVALYTVIDGAERPGLLTLRLKIEDRLITEAETVYVGIGLTGFGSVDNLAEAAPTWSEIVPPERRRSREEMIEITDLYFQTLEEGHKDFIPFTDDCLRVENGMITAGNPESTGIGAMACRENLNQPIWAYITHVNPRRYLAIDEERGLVSGMFMFRHTGTESSYVNDAGETVPFSEAMLRVQSVVISELFKIDDGKITRIEAVMTGGLPIEADDGWDE